MDEKIAEIKKTVLREQPEEQFEQQLKETGYTVPTFTEDLRANLISERLYDGADEGRPRSPTPT